MTTEIWIHKEDVEQIQRVLADFPSVQAFKLIYDSSSGIGYTTMIEFPHELEGREVSVIVPITTEENW